jgi:quinoprotein dehydrogenase-associated probable ABC transporter substrate-binding protein
MRWTLLIAAATTPLVAAGAQQPQPPQPQPPTSSQQAATAAPSADTPDTRDHALRVCSDPDNLPFSNRKEEGFENRIAALLASDLGDSVVYTWWPQRRGFVRNTLRARECDVLIGVPGGFDPVLETKPYYRSTYYIVTRTDRKLRVASLDDPALRKLKIAVNIIGEDYTNTPPAHALGARGIPVVGYSTFYNEENRPEDIINAVANGKVDVAIVWGPLAGYWAKRAATPLNLVPLPDSVDRTGFPFTYDIAVGVRRSDKAFKARIEDALVRRHDDIAKILQEYGVPALTQR